MMKPGKDSLDLGVLVGDIKASLHFYRDILGLAYVEEVNVKFGKMHRLRFGTSDFKLVEPLASPSRGPVGLEKQIGFRYVTFVITNLHELCQELERKGTEFAVKETEIRPGVRIAMVKDPDGNIVEFVERD